MKGRRFQKSRHPKALGSSSSEHEAAFGLYLSLGFTALGVHPRALKVKDAYVGEVLMGLRL